MQAPGVIYFSHNQKCIYPIPNISQGKHHLQLRSI